jgi:murein DD-endopeptidase MepM/ murein hydrolase activator NlpD
MKTLFYNQILHRITLKAAGILLFWALGACKEVQKLTDIIKKPSPRELYARNFEEENKNYLNWQDAFERAKADSISVTLPYNERGNFVGEEGQAHAYRVLLPEGRQLLLNLESEIGLEKVFVDIFRVPIGENDRALLSVSVGHNSPLVFPIPQTGVYTIVLQPSLGLAADFLLELGSRPVYRFPVADVEDQAIQSFWGAERDGGRRAHQGVDIFAPRGTPVVAASDGRVTSTGNRGLGGKQVWVRGGFNGKTQYYCHLDSVAVSPWAQIKRGDTLGFVGNTGNARATAPHLHFGIYDPGGAIDPLPFIQKTEFATVQIPVPPLRGKIRTAKANMRLGPKTTWTTLATLNRGDTVLILGSAGLWYRIRKEKDTIGFIHTSLIGAMD